MPGLLGPGETVGAAVLSTTLCSSALVCNPTSFRKLSQSRRKTWAVQARKDPVRSRNLAATDGSRGETYYVAEQQPSAAGSNLNTTFPSTYIGSPLLWIGVGVGLSVLFSLVSNSVKKYAMQQFMKSMMPQTNGNQLGSTFSFPTVAQPVAPSAVLETKKPNVDTSPISERMVSKTGTDTSAFQSKELSVNGEAFTVQKNVNDQKSQQSQKQDKPVFFKDSEVVDAGEAFDWKTGSSNAPATGSSESRNTGASGSSESRSSESTQSPFTVDALEKMLEDPTVQQMVYPYLPEEMRNPATFKWMMQNPQFRNQLQEMLNNMTEDGSWKSGQMADVLKNFNPNNQEMKQQFEQIGLSPEEVMAKMIANPEIAMAFQNPKIQAALVDCSQNPGNIIKYQNDKEVMDVFNKIADLFPIKGS